MDESPQFDNILEFDPQLHTVCVGRIHDGDNCDTTVPSTLLFEATRRVKNLLRFIVDGRTPPEGLFVNLENTAKLLLCRRHRNQYSTISLAWAETLLEDLFVKIPTREESPSRKPTQDQSLPGRKEFSSSQSMDTESTQDVDVKDESSSTPEVYQLQYSAVSSRHNPNSDKVYSNGNPLKQTRINLERISDLKPDWLTTPRTYPRTNLLYHNRNLPKKPQDQQQHRRRPTIQIYTSSDKIFTGSMCWYFGYLAIHLICSIIGAQLFSIYGYVIFWIVVPVEAIIFFMIAWWQTRASTQEVEK